MNKKYRVEWSEMNAEVWYWGPRECGEHSLGEDLLQGFFEGVEAETADVKLGATTSAAAAADTTTAVTASSVIRKRSITRRPPNSWYTIAWMSALIG